MITSEINTADSTSSPPYLMRGRTEGGLIVASAPSLWTPAEGSAGIIAVAPPTSLLVVAHGNLYQTTIRNRKQSRGEERPMFTGSIIIMSGSRHKEPTRVIGHPDLASGASVQRGDTLYVSVAEAIYRQSRGEYVEVRLTPSAEDNAALSDLRSRARHRWENDRLPDGWTRPLPQSPMPKEVVGSDVEGRLPDDLREIARELRARDRSKKE